MPPSPSYGSLAMSHVLLSLWRLALTYNIISQGTIITGRNYITCNNHKDDQDCNGNETKYACYQATSLALPYIYGIVVNTQVLYHPLMYIHIHHMYAPMHMHTHTRTHICMYNVHVHTQKGLEM